MAIEIRTPLTDEDLAVIRAAIAREPHDPTWAEEFDSPTEAQLARQLLQSLDALKAALRIAEDEDEPADEVVEFVARTRERFGIKV